MERIDRWGETASTSLDRIIFAVGTGSFVLSISFLAGKTSAYKDPSLLLCSWGILLVAILAQALHYWSIVKYASRTSTLLNDWESKQLEGDHGVSNDKAARGWIKLGLKLQYASFWLTILGALFIFLFGVANII